jgi:hypothetical protein
MCSTADSSPLWFAYTGSSLLQQALIISRKAQHGLEQLQPCSPRLKALRPLWLAIEEWRALSNSYRNYIWLAAVGKSSQSKVNSHGASASEKRTVCYEQAEDYCDRAE